MNAPHITIVDSLLLDKNEGTLLLNADQKLQVNGDISSPKYLQLVGGEIDFTDKAGIYPTQVLSLYATHPGQEVILPATLSRNGGALDIHVLSLQTSKGTLMMDVHLKGKRLYISSDTLKLIKPCTYEEGLVDIHSYTYVRNMLTGVLEIRTPYANLTRSTLQGPMIIKTCDIDIHDTLLQSDDDRFMHILANQMNVKNSVIEGLHQWIGEGDEARAKLENVDARTARIDFEGMASDIQGHTQIGEAKIDKKTYIAPDAIFQVDQITGQETLQSLESFGVLKTKQQMLKLKAEKDIFIRNLERTLEDGSEVDFIDLVLTGENVEVNGSIRSQHLSFEAKKELLLKQATLMGQVFALKAGLHLKVKEATLKAQNTIDIRAHEAKLMPLDIETETISIHLDRYDNGIEGVVTLAHDLVNCESVHLDARNESLIIKKPTQWRPNISLKVNDLEINSSLKSKGNISFEAETIAPIRCNVITANDFHLTAHHGDINFYKSVLDVMGDLEIEAKEGHYYGLENQYTAAGDLKIHAKTGLKEEAKKTRKGDSENYSETLHSSVYKAGGDIALTSDFLIELTSLTLEAGGDLDITAGQVHIDAIPLESGSVHRQKRRTDTYHDIVHQLTRANIGGEVSLRALRGTAIIEGADIKAGKGGAIYGVGGVAVLDKQDIHEHTVVKKKRRFGSGLFGGVFGFCLGGVFGGLGGVLGGLVGAFGWPSKKRVFEKQYRNESVGVTLEANKTFHIFSPTNVHLVGTKIKAPTIILQSMMGELAILQGENFESYVRQMNWDNGLWMRMKSNTKTASTHNPCMFVGDTHIFSPKVTIQEVTEAIHEDTYKREKKTRTQKVAPQYKVIDDGTEINADEFIKKRKDFIEGCEHHLKKANELHVHGSDVIFQYLTDRFTTDYQRSSGPGVITQIVIAVALSVATGGAGIGFLAGTGPMLKAVYAATISAILNCDGDLSEAVRRLASSDTLKNVIAADFAAALTGGLTHGCFGDVAFSPSTFIEHVQTGLIQTGVDTAVNTVVFGRGIDLSNMIRNFAGNVAGGYLSSSIGTAYDKDQIGEVLHKVLHAGKGAIQGCIKEGVDGIGPGAFGAALAETVAGICYPEEEKKKTEKYLKENKKTYQNGTLSAKEHQAYKSTKDAYDKKITYAKAGARIAVAFMAPLCGMTNADQIYMAMDSASTSLDYNFSGKHDKKDAEEEEEEDNTPGTTYISFRTNKKEGGIPELNFRAIHDYNGPIEVLSPCSRHAVNNYRDSLQRSLDNVGTFRLYDEDPLFDPHQEAITSYILEQNRIAGNAAEQLKEGCSLSTYEQEVIHRVQHDRAHVVSQAANNVAMVGTYAFALLTGAPALAVTTAGVVLYGSAGGLSAAAHHNFDLSTEESRNDIKNQMFLSGFGSTKMGDALLGTKDVYEGLVNNNTTQFVNGLLRVYLGTRTIPENLFSGNKIIDGATKKAVGKVSSAGASTPLNKISKEQPWVIHNEAHLWKNKIVGKAQRTGPKGTDLKSVINPHAKECYNIAIDLAKNPDVKKVFLNKGIKKASGHPIEGSNRRPDITYVTKDGKVHQIEVASMTDRVEILQDRMKETKNLLPAPMQGGTKVIKYKDYMRETDLLCLPKK